jgi:hypothetical protein
MRRASSRLFAGSLAIAIAALASTIYDNKLRRDFSAPTTTTMGTVIRKGAFIGRSPRSNNSEWFCWVEYQFSPPGGPPRTGWRMWSDACSLRRNGPVPVQYVIGNPDANRPPGAEPPVPTLLLWAVAGVMLVIAVLQRASLTDA